MQSCSKLLRKKISNPAISRMPMKLAPLPLGPVQGLVDPRDDPLEETLVAGLGDGLHGELHLLLHNGRNAS